MTIGGGQKMVIAVHRVPLADEELVREKGLEPSRLAAQEPKSCVYTNFTTPVGVSSVLSDPAESLLR